MKYRSMILCQHANEVPKGTCTCPKDCGCRETMCKTKWIEPNPKERELLYILNEEVVEIIEVLTQVHKLVSKVLRFGWHEYYEPEDKTNVERLESEIGDLLGVIDLFVINKNLDVDNIEKSRKEKKERIKQFSREIK